MPRSYDPRRFPGGPRTQPGGLRALRGPRRIGPIGAVIPGDDVEVARELARLRMNLRSPVTSGSGQPGCCPDLGDGPMRWVEGNYLQTYRQHSTLLGWWRLGEDTENHTPDGGMVFKDSSGNAKDLTILTPYAGDDYFRLDGPGPPSLGASDDGALGMKGQGASRALGGGDSTFQFPNNDPFTFTIWYAGGRDASYQDSDPIDNVAAERVLFGVRSDNQSVNSEGNAIYWNAQYKMLYFRRRNSGGSQTEVIFPYTFMLDDVQTSFWSEWENGTAFIADPELQCPWHHIAVSYDGATIRCYLDGVLLTSKASAVSMGASPTTSVRLGGAPMGVSETQRMCPGAFDEAAIFDEALSAGEILEIFRAGGDPTETGSWQEWEVGPADLSASFWESAVVPRRRVFEDVLSITSTTTLQAPLITSFVLANASGGAITLNLPSAADVPGARLMVKKTDSSANAVTVDPSGAETIDGAATFALSIQYDTLLIYSDGANWQVQARPGGGSGGSGISQNLLNAKGDVIVASADNTPGVETVGANDTVFTADSGQTRGVKWSKVGNAMVSDTAAIAYSKLNLAGSIVNADIAGGAAIAKSKLAALAIVNADVDAAAAIAKSKLAALNIVNADVDAAAAIVQSKLSFDAWQAFTPTLTATTTNPTMGTGATVTGSYFQIGKLVVGRLVIVFGGAGQAPGSGTYRIAVPVTAASAGPKVGAGDLLDNSANEVVLAGLELATTGTFQMRADIITGLALVTDAAPWVWAPNDQISFFFMYQAA